MARKSKQLVSEEPTQALELKKHVAVIHSNNKLTLLQRKIANALLFNAYKDLLVKDEHEIHIATLCKIIGYDSNDHKTIKKALVNLLSTVLEWNLVDGERLDAEGIWNASSIIADASIDGPICTYSYSNKMRKLLYRPNVYGRLDMQVQAKFQSSYGLALYENCNRFQEIGKSPWFEIHTFRKLMGVEDGKYKIFRDFKSRVLDKAIEEVNQYSSIKVDAQLRKEKRQVVAIQFLIKKSKTETSPLQLEMTTDAALPEILTLQFGLSKKQAEAILQNYNEEYIRNKITIVIESTSFKEGKIKNLAKYLLSALSEDYQPLKAVHKTVEQPKAEFHNAEKLQRQENEIQYLRYQDKQLLLSFDAYPPTEKQKTMKAFEKHLNTSTRGIYHDIYQREGIANPLIQDQLCQFLRRVKQQLLAAMMPFEEWILTKI